MKQGRTDKDWAMVALMAFLAGAFFVWALLSKHPPQPRPPLDVDWPAWVQAIGSIAAIGVAIYVPWMQRQHVIRDQKRTERLKARIMARALSPVVRRFGADLKTGLHFIDQGYTARQTIPEGGLKRPVEFDQFRQDLFLLGETGERINQLIGLHQTISNGVSAMRTVKDLKPPFVKKVKDDFGRCLKLVEQVDEEIDEILED